MARAAWIPSAYVRRAFSGPVLKGAKLAPVLKEGEDERDYPDHSNDHLLRPESIESIYLLWKTTKNEELRQRGWTMWQGIERETCVAHAHASVPALRGHNVRHSDSLLSECYFFGTLKDYYCLYSDADPWPLDKFVFNTEAHPLPGRWNTFNGVEGA